MARRDWVLAESAVPEESKSTVRALPFVEILFGSDMLFSMILYHRFFVLMAKIDSYDQFGLWKFIWRTKAFRTGKKRLFISHNVEYHKDVKLRETIGMAYAGSKDLSLHNPRAHEIRAWSASLAL